MRKGKGREKREQEIIHDGWEGEEKKTGTIVWKPQKWLSPHFLVGHMWSWYEQGHI